MNAGTTDANYSEAFTSRILPKIDDFSPDIILVSAGFDAHLADPLAQVCLSTQMYEWMTLRLMEKADQHAGGRLLSLLEGGYDLDALAQCVSLHVETLMHQ